jgi:hypothetical protein
MNNNEIFEDFWKTYVWPEPSPIFYRLYYNDAGEPIAYSMEDQPGKYIEITAEQFAVSDPHVRVKNGQLIKLTSRTVSKLIPAADGTSCYISNVAIVVDDTAPNQKWKLKNYDNS